MIVAVTDNVEPLNWRDWFAISFRWLWLLGLSISLVTQQGLPSSIQIIILFAACWNALLSVPVKLNSSGIGARSLHVAADLAFASVVFYLSGGLDSPVFWANILPVLTTALYYDSAGILLVSFASVMTQAGLALFTATPFTMLIYLVPIFFVYLLTGFTTNILRIGFERIPRKNWRKVQKERMDADRAEQDRKKGLYKVCEELSSEVSYPQLLDKLLDLTATLIASPQVLSACLLYSKGREDQASLQVKSVRGLSQSDLNIEMVNMSGLIQRTVSEGEARLTKNISQDAGLAKFTSLRTCQSACCVPVVAGKDILGVILFAHPDGEYFTKKIREDLEIVGRQAGIAIQNTLRYRQMEAEKDRIMEIHEDARTKLARELHDGPTQSIAALAMRVNFARRLMDRDQQATTDELVRVEDLARKTTKEIRHMLFTLRPLVLESQGLIPALEVLAGKMRETFSQKVSVLVEPLAIGELDASKQAVIYYIVEEAVNNARKHAEAEHIWIRIKAYESDITLVEIEDDGMGFSLETSENEDETRDGIGLGINIMRERAELVNGVLTLCSTEGKGSCIQVFIPVSEEASERLRREL